MEDCFYFNDFIKFVSQTTLDLAIYNNHSYILNLHEYKNKMNEFYLKLSETGCDKFNFIFYLMNTKELLNIKSTKININGYIFYLSNNIIEFLISQKNPKIHIDSGKKKELLEIDIKQSIDVCFLTILTKYILIEGNGPYQIETRIENIEGKEQLRISNKHYTILKDDSSTSEIEEKIKTNPHLGIYSNHPIEKLKKTNLTSKKSNILLKSILVMLSFALLVLLV